MSEQVAMNHTFFSLKLPHLAFVNHFTAPTFQSKASLQRQKDGKSETHFHLSYSSAM